MDPPGIPAGPRLLLPAALRKTPLFFSALSPAWKLLGSWTVPSPRPGEFPEKMPARVASCLSLVQPFRKDSTRCPGTSTRCRLCSLTSSARSHQPRRPTTPSGCLRPLRQRWGAPWAWRGLHFKGPGSPGTSRDCEAWRRGRAAWETPGSPALAPGGGAGVPVQ